MKLFTKIIFISICLLFLLESSNAVLPPRFESYKKNFLDRKVYVTDDYGWEYELKWADYLSFKSRDWYAHDNNSIYIWWEVRQAKIVLDNTFNNFYKDIVYTKNDKVYYKNKYDDLIEVTTKWDNLKVLYVTPSFVWIRSNDKFFNLDVSQWWFYSDARRLDVESWCNISTLEYENWMYVDGTNVCWYSYPVPKKVFEIVDKKVIQKYDNLSRWEKLDIHNFVYKKRSELYDKTVRINSSETIDKYLLVSMEYILQHISCGDWSSENYIGCFALHRRQLLYND